MFDESKFKEFLEKKTEKQKIIVVYWPTACWKTDLAIKIAKSINSEIISTDSRQVFKYLDIWTGKVTENEKQWIIHHMIDIIEPDREYSVWEFKVEAEKILENIFKKWKIPILCGGTGLYIDSLIYDFKIPKVPADARIRQDLEFEREKYWNEFIWKTDFREEKTLKYEIFFVTPYDWNRAKLYEKIDKRIKIMFETWLLEEVQDLLKKYNKNDFWMKTIWYKEIVDFLEWNMTLDECIALVQKNNRNYAKRQLTWFRRYEKN